MVYACIHITNRTCLPAVDWEVCVVTHDNSHCFRLTNDQADHASCQYNVDCAPSCTVVPDRMVPGPRRMELDATSECNALRGHKAAHIAIAAAVNGNVWYSASTSKCLLSAQQQAVGYVKLHPCLMYRAIWHLRSPFHTHGPTAVVIAASRPLCM